MNTIVFILWIYAIGLCLGATIFWLKNEHQHWTIYTIFWPAGVIIFLLWTVILACRSIVDIFF